LPLLKPACSAPARSSFELNTERRLLRDLTALNFQPDSENQSWVVARTSPGKSYSHVPGQFIDGRTGKIFTPPNARMVMWIEGSLHVLQTLSGPPQQDRKYQWDKPIDISISRSREEEDNFPYPYRDFNATVIVHINDTLQGEEKYGPTFVVPDEWVGYAPSAFTFWKNNAAVLVPSAATHLKQLEALVENPNPLIAVVAARSLAQAGLLDSAFVRGPLARAQGLRQSVLVCLVLAQLPAQKPLPLKEGQPVTLQSLYEAADEAVADEALPNDLAFVADQAPDSSTLKSLAMGTLTLPAWSQGSLASLFNRARCLKLLNHIAVRQKVLATRTEDDAAIQTVLEWFGVRPPVSASPADAPR